MLVFPFLLLSISYLSNTLTNLCIALYCILLYCVILNCIVLLIYCYVDIIQYNAMHKFVGVLDNPRPFGRGVFSWEVMAVTKTSVHLGEESAQGSPLAKITQQ